jgi:hypothetical protein
MIVDGVRQTVDIEVYAIDCDDDDYYDALEDMPSVELFTDREGYEYHYGTEHAVDVEFPDMHVCASEDFVVPAIFDPTPEVEEEGEEEEEEGEEDDDEDDDDDDGGHQGAAVEGAEDGYFDVLAPTADEINYGDEQMDDESEVSEEETSCSEED